MDEATRLIIAYGTLFIGIPLLTAKVLWFVPGAISRPVFSLIARELDQFIGAAVEGFLAQFLTCLVFQHFQLPVAWKVPIALIIVTLIWNRAGGGTWGALPSILGIVSGFFLYPQLMPVLARYTAGA